MSYFYLLDGFLHAYVEATLRLRQRDLLPLRQENSWS